MEFLRLGTKQDVVEMYKISMRKLQYLMVAGLPYIRTRRRVVFNLDEVDEYFRQQKQNSCQVRSSCLAEEENMEGKESEMH